MMNTIVAWRFSLYHTHHTAALTFVVPAGTWRFPWETWVCLTPLRSTTEVSLSPTWRRPWLNWATTCSASSFICTGERVQTYTHWHLVASAYAHTLYISCSVSTCLCCFSSMILALINDWRRKETLWPIAAKYLPHPANLLYDPIRERFLLLLVLS